MVTDVKQRGLCRPMAKSSQVVIRVDGVEQQASAPLIVSASRATDVPAFHGAWLMRRLEAGFVRRTNPFNGKPSYISLEQARLFVFWTKNPQPFLARLDELDRRGLGYYFQFTLNDFEAEGLEPGLPPLEARVATFVELARRIGPERVIWRFDPLILADALDVGRLLAKLAAVGDRLHAHTRRLVISFADIEGYAKVERNLRAQGVRSRPFAEPDMRLLAQGLAELNRRWGLALGTCAETVDLAAYGIGHNRCVDDRLIERVFSHDDRLMAFLRGPRGRLKDKGQRKACGCIVSKDIGAYDTCPHLCSYCYANGDPRTVARRAAGHDPDSPSL